MAEKRRNVLKDLIWKLIQKMNILAYNGIMKIFDGVYIYLNRLYANNYWGNYINEVLWRKFWIEPGKIKQT